MFGVFVYLKRLCEATYGKFVSLTEPYFGKVCVTSASLTAKLPLIQWQYF